MWLHKKLHKKLQSQWEKLRHKRLQKSLHTIYGVSRSKSMGKLHQKSYPPYMVFPVQSQWEKLRHKSYSLYMEFKSMRLRVLKNAKFPRVIMWLLWQPH